GFTVVRAVADRYDGRLRTDITDRAWGYSGNPFCDDECGKFYARPMSIWSMLLACQGFVCDGPAGVIGFRPIWKPDDHCSFFTAAEGWGLFTQTRRDGRQTERIEVRCGKLALTSLVFELPEDMTPSRVSVTLNDDPIEATHALANRRLEVRLASRMTVGQNETLSVVVA
ncbi:MAG: glucosylceramidase, partial [Armatimonadota bacterium]